MMKDLVLEWESGEGRKQDARVILPNIQGQRFVFGFKYPGDEGRVGEEFIFFRKNGILVDHTLIVIHVDEQGQYWTQSDTDTAKFQIFVNTERLISMEPHLLRIGDTVFLEESKLCYGYTSLCHPIFHVKEMIVPARSDQESDSGPDNGDSDNDIDQAIDGSDSDSDNACKATNDLDDGAEADSPLNIPLILEKILSYLHVMDLKNVRLVCKKWTEEASKPLEKRGKVTFSFSDDYYNPENSTRVFRYLHEMRDIKMRNLHIHIYSGGGPQTALFFSPGEPGQKMVDDLRKLLKSPHNFSSLVLQVRFFEEPGFLPFSTIFQELGEKLVELTLVIFYLSLPTVLPPFQVMSRLKKITNYGYSMRDDVKLRWFSHFVPLFSNNLEHFTCYGYAADTYLEEFKKHPTPNLKRIILRDKASEKSLSALQELEIPLTFLEINYSEQDLKAGQLLESLFLKNSKSLKHLIIKIGNDNDDFDDEDTETEVSFPSFQKLEVLELMYERKTRIGWGYETSLDYGKHFPSLRKLTVRPLRLWSGDDHVFNAFFPEEGELRCETVEDLWVPVLQNPPTHSYWLYVSEVDFQPRMNQIRKMFPNAGNIKFFL